MEFFLVTVSRPALKPTQSPIQWVPGALTPGVNRPSREAVHSPPSGAEVKNAWGYTYTPPVCLHGMVLSKSTRTNLPLHFYRFQMDGWLTRKLLSN
jgi:hypothetical protein